MTLCRKCGQEAQTCDGVELPCAGCFASERLEVATPWSVRHVYQGQNIATVELMRQGHVVGNVFCAVWVPRGSPVLQDPAAYRKLRTAIVVEIA